MILKEAQEKIPSTKASRGAPRRFVLGAMAVLLFQAMPNLSAGTADFLQEGPYAIVASAYAEAQSLLASEGIPEEILEERVMEAVAKRVPPARLLEILPLDEARLSSIAASLAAREMAPSSRAASAKLYRSLFLVTTGIISMETLEAYMDALPRGPASAVPLGAWADTCVSLYNLSSLDDGEMRTLGIAILGRGFKPASYATLPGLFLKARRNGLSDGETLRSMMRILGRGGSMLQIEDELSRRRGP